MTLQNNKEYIKIMLNRANGNLPEMWSSKQTAEILRDKVFKDSQSYNILDVGGATGHYYRSFFEDPVKKYTVLEIDENMVNAGIDYWKNTKHSEKIDFINQDFEKINNISILPDIIICINAFMYFSSIKSVLKKFIKFSNKYILIRSYFSENTYRIIRSQSEYNHDSLIISEYENILENGNFQNYDYWNIYSINLVESILKNDFKSVKWEWIENMINELELKNEKSLIKEKRGSTEVFNNFEISFPFLLPWKYLLITKL